MSTVTFDTLDFTRKLRDAGLVTREHFDAKTDLLRLDIIHTRWMIGIVIVLATANFAKQFF